MVTVFKAREREETAIPIKDLLEEGKVIIFPEVLRKKYFDIRFGGDKLVVTAGKYVGLIYLNEKIAIDVQPKTPVGNLLTVLSKARADVFTLKRAEAGYTFSGVMPDSILEGMVDALIERFQQIEIEGLLKRYESFEYTGSAVKGQINFGASLQRFWSRGTNHVAACSFYDLTCDIPENRLLRYACYLFLRHYSELGISHELTRALGYFNELFIEAGITLTDPVLIPTFHIDQNLPDHYVAALKLAKALLMHRGIDLPAGGEDIYLPSFLVDMETVFEDYCRQVLRQDLAQFQVLDGNADAGKPFFDDRQFPPANPDIVICAGTTVVLLCEVKYKLKLSREDLNQVVAYAVCYRVKQVVLLMPAEYHADCGLNLVGEIDGIKIYKYGFFLSAPSLDAEEAKYISEMRTLLDVKIQESAMPQT